MTLFLKSQGNRVTKVITNKFIEPNSDEDTCSHSTIKKYEANAKASYALMQALNDDDVSRVINCTLVYDIWKCLIITHEGTSQMKKVKIDFLNSLYDSFYMLDIESIDDMLTRFTTITNELVS